jgi:hypothetical protein
MAFNMRAVYIQVFPHLLLFEGTHDSKGTA